MEKIMSVAESKIALIFLEIGCFCHCIFSLIFKGGSEYCSDTTWKISIKCRLIWKVMRIFQEKATPVLGGMLVVLNI